MQQGIIRNSRACPACGNNGTIIRTRFRCPSCGQIWGIRGGSILEGSKMPAWHFLEIVRCYSDDLAPGEASRYTGLPPGTIRIFYEKIRRAILDGGDTGTREDRFGIAAFSAGEPPMNPVALGIRSAGGIISAHQVHIAGNDLVNALQVPRNLWGNILFVTSYGLKYPGYILYYPGRRGTGTILIKPRTGEPWPQLDGFWHFSEKILRQHPDLDRNDLPAFIQETVFRFNHRNTDLFQAIVNKIARYDYSR